MVWCYLFVFDLLACVVVDDMTLMVRSRIGYIARHGGDYSAFGINADDSVVAEAMALNTLARASNIISPNS